MRAREAHEGDLPRHAAITAPLLAAVFCGGTLGAVARIEVARLVDTGAWPWPTLLVNLAGAFLLGVVVTGLRARARALAFWGPGLCGGLTTFSTLQVELVRMGDHGRWGAALAYAAATLAGGLVAVRAGAAAAA